jgi:paraquat-inducible protein B
MAQPSDNLESTKKFHFNTIWFVPFIAIIVAGWMLYSDWSQRGIEITIIAQDAEGLEANKTTIKARNVDLGEVKKIKLSDDFQTAIITVQMQKGSEALLTENTKFWVVKPRVGKEGISGLGTILSGAYINMQPSQAGKAREIFEMLKQPPLSTTEDKGIRLQLFSTKNSKMEVGAPVHFRGYQVGYIEDVNFDIDRSAITYRLFIKAPYDALVNNTVQFWMTPGVSVKGSAKGLEVKMDSLETFLSGGISFGSIDTAVVPQPIKDLTEFELFPNKEEAINHRYDQHISYIALLKGSISGLEPGAPIEFNGIRIGTVAEVPYRNVVLDATTTSSKPQIPVLINIEPQRFDHDFNDKSSLDYWKNQFEQGFKKGGRATLITSNLLSGSKIVSIVYGKEDEAYKPQVYDGYSVFPTTNDSLATMQNKVEVILDKLATLPINQSVEQLNTTLASTNQTINSINAISKKVDALLARKETQALPAEVSRSLDSLTKALQSYQGQGDIGQNLNQNLMIMRQTLEDLQPILQQLKQKPNSLIFGKPTVADLQPQAAGK